MNLVRTALMALVLATSTRAIKLQPGLTWEWRVVNRTLGTAGYRIATVLDSAEVEQGTVWRIAANDSLGNRDTGSVLVQRNGHSSWLRKSSLMMFEWQPFDPLGDSAIRVGIDTSYRWGEIYCNKASAKLAPGWNVYQFSNADGVLVCKEVAAPTSAWSVPVVVRRLRYPKAAWEDSIGFRLYSSYGQSQIEDWTLVRIGARRIAVESPNRIVLPQVGDTLQWAILQEVSSSTETRFLAAEDLAETRSRFDAALAWTVTDRKPDTADWVTLTIQETLANRTTTTTTRNLRTTFGGANPETDSSTDPSRRISLSDTGSTLRLRVNLLTGHCVLLSTRLFAGFTPEDAWQEYWDDSLAGSSRFPVSNTTAEGVRIVENQADSSWKKTSFENTGSVPMGSSTSRHSTVTTASRMARGLEISVSRHRPRQEGLLQLAGQFPETIVRWRNVRGQQGRIEAKRLADLPASLRGGILFLDAVFPDGTRWNGSRFIPH